MVRTKIQTITFLMKEPAPHNYNGSLCVTILTHYQTTNFRLFQTARVCRQQFQNLTKKTESYPNVFLPV